MSGFQRLRLALPSGWQTLVEFGKPTFRNFMDLSFYLEDLFGRKVDLVTVKGLHPRIRSYVEKVVIRSEPLDYPKLRVNL